ncbi:hypothetical protein [Mangrovicoccus ximenensis]|uniref:hypothetical protein n=1 Tax=Mangrovicoccus ximenensis TaxID=1911570 RepID=UPI000D3D4AE8|nr:hypothetical protein [Mangrovicoccus ximenensis]
MAERFRLSCSVSSGATLQYSDHDDQSTEYGKLRFSLGCSARLAERVSVRANYIYYPIQHQQAPWDPDYTYAISWRVTDVLLLDYSNYSARFAAAGAYYMPTLMDGNLRAYLALPKIRFDETRVASCSFGLGLPSPADASWSLGCNMPLTEKLRVGLTGYAYPPRVHEPWSPDFSYTASYELTEKIRISYANYSNNRLPWNDDRSHGPGVLGGSITVSYRLSF